jgi:sugar lactone lactonase YvrE
LVIWSWQTIKKLVLCLALAVPIVVLGCQPKETNGNGSTDGTTGEPPLAQFSYQPALPVIEEYVIFDGSASRDRAGGKLVSYEWNFGDGATGQGVITKHTYTAAGEYSVQLTVTNDKGAKGTAQQKVRVFGKVSIKKELAAPGLDPRGLAWDEKSLWVADGYEGAIFQIDPGTGKVLKSYEAPTASADALPMPEGLAWDGTSLWMISVDEAKILKLRPQDGKVLAALSLPSEDATGLAWDGGALWVSDPRGSKLYRVDPNDGRVLKSVAVADIFPGGLAWDGSALWLSDEIDGKLYRFDPGSGKPTLAAKGPGGAMAGLTWDGEALWVAVASEDGDSGKLYRVEVPR